jgi:hypothetical protein
MLGYNQARGLNKIIPSLAPQINSKTIKSLKILQLAHALIDFVETSNLPLTVVFIGSEPECDLDLKHSQTKKAFHRHTYKLKNDISTLLESIYKKDKKITKKVISSIQRYISEIVDEVFRRKIATNYVILANEILKEYFTNDEFDGYRQKEVMFFEFQNPKRYDYLKSLKFKDIDLRGFELTGAVRDFLERVR